MASMLGSYPIENYLLGDSSPKGESVIAAPTITAPIQKISVTIVTGLLGSGKGLLLSHLMSNAQGLKVAVLVDQFGDLELDDQQVVSQQSNRIELSNGCIGYAMDESATIESLINAVSQVIEHEAQIDYLVIETDQLANPPSLMTTFMDAELSKIARLDSLLCIVNAQTFGPARLKHSVYVNQLLYSDIIVLNTPHSISADKVSAIEQDIHLLKSGAQILSCNLKDTSSLPLSALLDVGLADAESCALREKELLEEDPLEKELSGINLSDYLVSTHFVSVPFCSDRPFDLTKFEHFLMQQLPNNLFRAKGTLWFQDQPHRYIFQLAGKQHRLSPDPHKPPPSQNKLVFIGHKLNPLQLQQQLINCLTGQPVSLLSA